MMASKHDDYIGELEVLVRGNYQIVLKNVEYRMPRHPDVVGEMDLVGIVDDQWDIYEVKSNGNMDKAREQLLRAKSVLGDCANIRLFYYSGKEKKIIKIG